ncbi:MAG: NAD-dependent epimerase/dehydratase family protein [Polyangia bacterium]
MKIALAGGTGFIGTPTARAIAALGHEVDAFGRARTQPRFAPDVVVCFMLLNADDARAAVAAYAGARLVAISSGDVYRAYGELLGIDPPTTPAALLDEDAPLRATLYPYGRRVEGPWGPLADYDKILVERVVRDADPRATILRLAKVYGAAARDRPLHRWVEHMRAHDEVPVGARQGRWRWTHGFVDDVAAAIALAAVDERAAGRVYNVGERATPTQKERVSQLAAANGWRGRIVDVDDAALPPPLRDRTPGAPDLAFDTRRIRDELGFVEPTPYDETLRRT